MGMKLEERISSAICKRYEEAMAAYPSRKKEVDALLETMEATDADWLRFLYAYMHVNDVVSYKPQVILSYLNATKQMYEELDYVKQVPQELFLTYVLAYRVNNENLDESRSFLYEELKERVKGKSMTEACLEVNYWCYEKATYIPSDDRTISPLTMCKSARGRCGEESMLAVSAMRSVGIPARQCYVPRWAHCDDNHAWVEVWADGKWHYLGACEPEPVLNKGWFTAAASKAMLVHAKAYSEFLGGEEAAYQTPLYALMNSTETYADCVRLQVTVLDGKKPAEQVRVSFQLVNYSELFELYHEMTNQDGKASFLTGRGDLYVCAAANGRFVGRKVDIRQEESIVLNLQEGICPEALEEVYEERFDLLPPTEVVGELASSDQKQKHEARLAECEAIRAAYEATFVKEEGAWAPYFEAARGNFAEIEQFRAMEGFKEEDKLLLLETLRPKDCMDCTADMLASYLKNALPYQTNYPMEIYKKEILAPRIANEMLVACRPQIVSFFAERGIHWDNAKDIWNYIHTELTIVSEYDMKSWMADTLGCLEQGICTETSLPLVFVQICRAFGIPARLNPVTGEPEARIAEEDGFVKMSQKTKQAEDTSKQVKLTVKNTGKNPVSYELLFTIGRYENGRYHTFHYPELVIEKKHTFLLEPGTYRLLTAFRQIDGSVSAVLKTFVLKEDRELSLELGADETIAKIRSIEMPDGMVKLLDEEGREGEFVSLRSLYAGKESVFMMTEPGKEPTEHLMQELLECQADYKKKGYRLILAMERAEGLKNETVSRVIASGMDIIPVLCTDENLLYEMRAGFGVGDERLPFAAAIDKDEYGLFAFANYNIRTAWTLQSILQAAVTKKELANKYHLEKTNL